MSGGGGCCCAFDESSAPNEAMAVRQASWNDDGAGCGGVLVIRLKTVTKVYW
jgi:hypothetical protein